MEVLTDNTRLVPGFARCTATAVICHTASAHIYIRKDKGLGCYMDVNRKIRQHGEGERGGWVHYCLLSLDVRFRWGGVHAVVPGEKYLSWESEWVLSCSNNFV